MQCEVKDGDMLRIRWNLLVVSILIPLANVQGDDAQGTVTGIVILEQDPPAPLMVKMKRDMQMFTGKKTLSIQRWIVGSNRTARAVNSCLRI